MAGRITCGLWMVVFLSGCGRLSAFNLDTDNVQLKSGDPGSLFGFSLAMHEQVNPEPKRMLLVGAPRAKGWMGQKSKVTGGLYTCDMASSSSTCNRVVFDQTEDLSTESKENQWMGVTVSSQGPAGKVMACAHRYQRRSNVGSIIESRDIIGRCAVLSESLTVDDINPEEGEKWNFCDSRPRGHEMFGSCQQGLSATFDKDYHYLIFGAPGAYNWKGIVRLEQRNDSLIDIYGFDDGPFEAGDESQNDPNLVPAPPNSYLGFSLDSAKKVTGPELTVVAGAPRANHSGAVVLLKIPENKANNLLEEFTLEGEGLASSFGYDLTVLDLNADGWNDIVVGAPQYFEKDGEIGGAIYVYVNNAGKWKKIKPTRIDGPKDSMFGMAVENLGDINQDGFHDFAVGAPYEDDGVGKVYIYHGAASPMGISSTKASQVLDGQPLRVKLFGYSLAGNMDLDKNAYPDLAVGSLSDSVFVYKARPVINIKKEISFTPKEIDLTKKNCGTNFCLEVKACFTYTANPPSYAPKLMVVYSLVADADNKEKGLIPRATFLKSTDLTYESKGTLAIDRKGEKQCIQEKLTIPDNIKDKLHGIPIDVSVDIQDSNSRRRRSTSELAPVLDANEEKTTREMVSFLKEGCGTDNVCQSNLQVKYRYGYRTTDDDTFTPLELEGGVPVILLSNQKDIALEVKMSNPNGDDAYQAMLTASFPRTLTYSAFRVAPNENPVSCTANRDGSVVECDVGNPFRQNSETTFYIILGTSRISLNTSEVAIDLQINTTSTQKLMPVKAKAKVSITLQLSVSGLAQPSQVYFSGDVKGEAAMKTESDIGSAITHQFRIVNLGKNLKELGTATLDIEWPKETEEGKWLLYLMKITATGVDQLECSHPHEVNPLKKEPTSTRTRRAAGNAEKHDEGTISLFTDKKDSKTVSCGSGAKCVNMKCPLRGLDSNAVINLHSRLWNSTFIEDYSKVHHVEVIVKATLHVDSTIKNTVLQKADTQVRLTVFPERRSDKYGGGVPWWIIVLSILFGLMLLALLAFVLWKCGFFERAKYEDKVPSYNAVRIKREERAINPKNGNWENLEKKPWMTTWHDKEHFS